MAIGPSGGFMKRLFNPAAMKKKAVAGAGMAKAQSSGEPMGTKKAKGTSLFGRMKANVAAGRAAAKKITSKSY